MDHLSRELPGPHVGPGLRRAPPWLSSTGAGAGASFGAGAATVGSSILVLVKLVMGLLPTFLNLAFLF